MTLKRSNASADGSSQTFGVEATRVQTGVSTSCLARYERARIVQAVRVGGRRFYRASDLKRIRKAHRLEHELGINLAGVEVIMRLTEQLDELQRRLAAYEGPARDGSRRL